jgi:hypothetical protein
MTQTAIEWLHQIFKQREPDKFDWEKAKAMEKEQMICFHNWMMKNDTPENAERYFHYTDNDMIREHYKETYNK